MYENIVEQAKNKEMYADILEKAQIFFQWYIDTGNNRCDYCNNYVQLNDIVLLTKLVNYKQEVVGVLLRCPPCREEFGYGIDFNPSKRRERRVDNEKL